MSLLAHHHMYMNEIQRTSCGSLFSPPTCGLQGAYSGHKSWQVPFSTKPSCWSATFYFEAGSLTLKGINSRKFQRANFPCLPTALCYKSSVITQSCFILDFICLFLTWALSMELRSAHSHNKHFTKRSITHHSLIFILYFS